MKFSLRWASTVAHEDQDENVKYEQEAFGLCLAVVNKDLPMLTELWSQTSAWNIYHLIKLLQEIVTFNWKDGFNFVMKSATTDILFHSNLPKTQVHFVSQLIQLRAKMPVADQTKIMDEILTKKPYAYLTVISIVNGTELAVND